MLLSPIESTGTKIKSKQVSQLRVMGILFYVNAAGSSRRATFCGRATLTHHFETRSTLGYRTY
ncbi:MAG: DUF4224 domain-containing protein [Nitrosomonas sp.]|nr:DUF4224 domain-containing protein [Nitrosomonas sp.]